MTTSAAPKLHGQALAVQLCTEMAHTARMPSSPSRKNLGTFFALFGAALLVRIIGLTWGLPNAQHWFSYHPDERQIAVAVANLDLLGGDWNPNFFNYPSLYIYATAILYNIWSLLGFAAAPIGDAPWPVLRDITLCGRVVSAVAGALTVPILYLWLRRALNERAAGWGALLCALAPGLVQHSHFATVDIAATFGVVLALYLASLAQNSDDKTARKYLHLSALVCGLAMATKYNAILVIIAPLLIAAMQANWRKYIPSIVVVSIVGFVLGCPFSVLNFPEFWGSTDAAQERGFAFELLTHPRIGSGEIFQNTGNGWWYQATFNLPFALSWPLLIAAIFGAFWWAKSSEETSRKYLWPALAFCGLYFLAIGTSQVRFMRYVLPLAPILCAFAGASLDLWSKGNSARKYGSGALVFFLTGLAVSAIQTPFQKPDARDDSAQFIRETVPSGAVIGIAERPWFYTPSLLPQNAPMGESFSALETPDGKLEVRLIGWNAARLKREAPQIWVMSEFEWRDKERLGDKNFQSVLQVLAADYEPASRFKVSAPLALPGRQFVPHDYLYVNPEVRVYRRKER